MTSSTTGDFSHLIDGILQPLFDHTPGLWDICTGCSPEDLAFVQSRLGLELPAAFAALLSRIGRERGNLMAGADFGFPHLLEFRGIAESLLAEHTGLTLDPADIVFDMEQGYQFFLIRSGTDDPPVYFFDDDDPHFAPVTPTFSAWVQLWVAEEIALRRLKQSPE